MTPRVSYRLGLWLPWLLLLLVFVLAQPSPALPVLALPHPAPTLTTYDLSWNVIGGGSALATTGNYALAATVGQGVAGPVSAGSYTLNSGFWQGANFAVYLPIVLK